MKNSKSKTETCFIFIQCLIKQNNDLCVIFAISKVLKAHDLLKSELKEGGCNYMQGSIRSYQTRIV